jgi:hypothetical protein
MINYRHLLRMARWARHPPSPRRVALVFGVVAVCLALFGLEKLGVIPDFGFSDRPVGTSLKLKPLN